MIEKEWLERGLVERGEVELSVHGIRRSSTWTVSSVRLSEDSALVPAIEQYRFRFGLFYEAR